MSLEGRVQGGGGGGFLEIKGKGEGGGNGHPKGCFGESVFFSVPLRFDLKRLESIGID